MEGAMDAMAHAEQLRREADEIIYDRGLDGILKSWGLVWYTGSYALNTMAWPDIDMILLKSNPASLTDFFEIGREVAQMEGVIELKFWNYLIQSSPFLPHGLYWGARMETGKQPIPWKIDIWVTEPKELDESKANMKRLQDAMTEDARRLIVQVKHNLLTDEGRTPQGSGYFVYQAVLFEKLTNEEDIRAYVRSKGIQGV
jgi:hypothetical protein